MKKLFALLLTLAMVLSLAACGSKEEAPAETETPAETEQTETPAEPASAPVAPGTAGQLKLHDVEPKTAAMLMAIVADKLGKPLNELRFISIKEVK